MIIGNAVITGRTNGKKPILALDEGTVIMVNENGSPVEYYLAGQNYQAGLNGRGRTLLVRKDIYCLGAWNDAGTNAYAGSSVDTMLNTTVKELYDADVQAAMGETVFPYTPGSGDDSVSTLSRSVFLLSQTELGRGVTNANKEGEVVAITKTLQVAYLDSVPTSQWSRTPRKTTTDSAFYLSEDGDSLYAELTENYGIRPCFTLSGLTTVAPDANEDGSYTLDLTA